MISYKKINAAIVVRCLSMTNQSYIFTFREDRLTIYEEAHVHAQSTETIMCGSDPPHQIASRSNKIILNFQTDSSTGDAGFRIKIERGK